MKKNLYFAVATAFALVACNKPTGFDAINVSFIGDAVQTKISIGDKVGTSYPGIWEEGDAIDVYNATSGIKIGVATLQAASVGRARGVFDFAETVAPGTKLKVVYPSGATESAFAVASEQNVVYGDKSIAATTYACSDELTATDAEPVEFTLEHKPAIVKVKISSEEYVGYSIKKVQLYSAGAKIAGSYTGTASYDVINATPSTAAKLSEARELWFTALPAQLSEVYVVVYLERTLTGGAVRKATIPVKYTDVALMAGQVNSITLNALAHTMNSCPWYQVSEDRELLSGVAGAGYAYGPQNTVFVTKKNSSSYVGQVDIDVRATGEFTKVKEPKTCAILCDGAGMNRTGSFAVASSDVADGKITVNAICGSNYVSKDTWGTVAIKDAAGEILWSYMVQGVFDVDTVANVDYGTFQMMDRPLGSTFSIKWMAEHKTGLTPKASRTAWDTNNAFFQWGRKDPFSFDAIGATTNASGANDVSDGIKNPRTFYLGSKSWTKSNPNYNLWGTDKHKTIFDPCPKGYKVPVNATLADYLKGKTTKDEAKANLAVYNVAVTLPSGTDYWPYTGALWGSASGAWSTRTARNSSTNNGVLEDNGYFYWTNSCSKGVCGCFVGFNSTSSGWTETTTQNSVQGMAVRCMVDPENL